MMKFPKPPLAAMVGFMAIVAVAQPARAQTRIVVVQDGPNTVLIAGRDLRRRRGREPRPDQRLGSRPARRRRSDLREQRRGARSSARRRSASEPGSLSIPAPAADAGDTAMLHLRQPARLGAAVQRLREPAGAHRYRTTSVRRAAARPARHPRRRSSSTCAAHHTVAPGADDILIYQPAAQSVPCLAGATGSVPGVHDRHERSGSGELSSAAGILPPGFLLVGLPDGDRRRL